MWMFLAGVAVVVVIVLVALVKIAHEWIKGL